MSTQRLGGTAVVMERFDALAALDAIERHRVTHAQFVPTMFVRMLRLPSDVRARFDLSSLRMVVHAAAPCPPDVKRAVIEWLGPIVHEFYAGSEGAGFCTIDTPTWLERSGSVGRPLRGAVHILDEAGSELPVGAIGTVYFSGTGKIAYHNDPEKTAAAHSAQGWPTLGDLGSVDADGFLYLADRRTDLIVTGGVNVYPQEIENVLLAHPAVDDVAVVGLSDPEMGQRVVAVVVPQQAMAGSAALTAWLDAHCREQLAGFKCPRRYDFRAELPRLESGKLARRQVRDNYETA